MDTHFAPPEKTGKRELAFQITLAAGHQVVSALLQSVGGMLAVVNDRRQIVALNDGFLRALGVVDPEKHLGLRLGESLECVHAGEEPAGCGTTRYCSSCGAAVAMVACLEENRPVEKVCALAARRGGERVDIVLAVRAHPIGIEGRKFLLLFLQDITRQERRAALERTFFHDINNMLNAIQGAGEMLAESEPSPLVELLLKAVSRLTREVAIQQSLARSDAFAYRPDLRRLNAAGLLGELKESYIGHPAAAGKKIAVEAAPREAWIRTDRSLLLRVLGNMLINALEATPEGGEVRLGLVRRSGRVAFRVWNAGEIVPEAVLRMFQRNFSTKAGAGRGFGTYSMKLFGEQILKGRVSFTTSPREGTVFEFSCPESPGAAG